jgi:predicted amidohydrolase
MPKESEEGMQVEENDKTLSYYALALQIRCHSVNHLTNGEEAHLQMRDTIDRLRQQIRASTLFIGPDTRLVVLPEYFLTGFPQRESVEAWATKACLDMEGPEYEALGQIAQENNLFLAGNAYELDPHFPTLYFQTCFVIDPSGTIILRYRRLNSLFAPTPHDVWEHYLDLYGLDGVFPVAHTEIGNLGVIASEEILYPEIARCFVMRGAEILLHSSSEISSPLPTQKHIARQARAIENMAYLISANTAGIAHSPIPDASTDGGSAILDYHGLVLAEAGSGESMVAHAEIDLAALRQYRRRSTMNNFLSRQRFELYAESYRQHSFYPPNTLADTHPSRNHFMQTQKETIERLAKLGVI